jgi:hypothetical protein
VRSKICRNTLTAGLAAIAVSLVLALPAAASTRSQIIQDCSTQGRLARDYSLGDLQAALHSLTASTSEYSSCVDVLNRAIAAKVASQNAAPATAGSGGSFLPTPVIVVLIVLLMAAGGFGVQAIRRRR